MLLVFLSASIAGYASKNPYSAFQSTISGFTIGCLSSWILYKSSVETKPSDHASIIATFTIIFGIFHALTLIHPVFSVFAMSDIFSVTSIIGGETSAILSGAIMVTLWSSGLFFHDESFKLISLDIISTSHWANFLSTVISSAVIYSLYAVFPVLKVPVYILLGFFSFFNIRLHPLFWDYLFVEHPTRIVVPRTNEATHRFLKEINLNQDVNSICLLLERRGAHDLVQELWLEKIFSEVDNFILELYSVLQENSFQERIVSLGKQVQEYSLMRPTRIQVILKAFPYKLGELKKEKKFCALENTKRSHGDEIYGTTRLVAIFYRILFLDLPDEISVISNYLESDIHALSEFEGYHELWNSLTDIKNFMEANSLDQISAVCPSRSAFVSSQTYIRPNIIRVLTTLGQISQEIRIATTASSRVNQLAALARADADLQTLDQFVTDRIPPGYPEQKLLHRIIHQWREIITTAAGAVGQAQILSPIANPYVVGPPVRGQLFVGREDILSRLEELWMPQGQLPSVILYGHRRMGKTSILQNLKGHLGQNTQIIDFNLQRVGMVENVGELLYNLATALHDSLPDNTELEEPNEENFLHRNPYSALDRFLRKLDQSPDRQRHQTRYIITIDEFEILEKRLIQQEIIAPYLIEYWRSLIVTYPWFILAFAGLASLQEMTQDYWNPLFGNVTAVPVGVLSEKAAERLITNPTDDFPLDYDRDAIHEIYTLTGGQPYLIQLICHSLISRFNRQRFEEGQEIEPRLTLNDVQEIIQSPDFFRDGNAYFSGVWSQCQEEHAAEQIAILQGLCPHPNGLTAPALAQRLAARQLDFESAQVTEALSLLQRHDVIHLSEGRYTFVVELMRCWVEQEKLTV